MMMMRLIKYFGTHLQLKIEAADIIIHTKIYIMIIGVCLYWTAERHLRRELS